MSHLHPSLPGAGGARGPRSLLLFDIDGTLIKTGKIVRRVFRKAVLDTYHDVGTLDTYGFAGKTDPQIVSAVLAESSVPPGVVAGRLQECLDRYMDNLEAALPTEPVGTVLPGVRDLLEKAANDRRCVLGLLTGNVERGARIKLTALGLYRYFRFGAFSSDNPVRDELPGVALRRAEEVVGIRFSPEACFVIGDTEHDVRCARAGGMRAVAVASGGVSREALAACKPDFLFDDLTRPDDVLAPLLGEA